MTERMPEDWNTPIICPIYKKGDAMDCGNYKVISLLYTTLFNIILNHLRPYAVDIIGYYQSGFLVGRSTIDQALIDKYYEFNKKLHLLSISDKHMTQLKEMHYYNI